MIGGSSVILLIYDLCACDRTLSVQTILTVLIKLDRLPRLSLLLFILKFWFLSLNGGAQAISGSVRWSWLFLESRQT